MSTNIGGGGGIEWKDLFPTKLSIFIFIGYMSLFISQGILVTASQETNNSYKYNTVTVVLLTEILKLLISTALYCKENTFRSLLVNVIDGRKVLLLYFVPAFLYCLYNNLAFINLSVFDPTTYYLLLQFRVVITGILFQIIFKKYLSTKQWLSLILLTIGCMVKQVNFSVLSSLFNSDNNDINNNNNNNSNILNSNTHNGKNINGFDFSINAIFILIQTICSCLAGVYNEYLLKDKGSDINIYVQNVFMYLDSIICNGIILMVQGNLVDAFTSDSLRSVFKFNVIIIMFNNAAIGIITSFFLKYMNSILKTFASALELMFTALLCYLLFAIPIYLNTILAIGIVSFAIYLYTQSPVINYGSNNNNNNMKKNSNLHDDQEKLLNTNFDLDMDEI